MKSLKLTLLVLLASQISLVNAASFNLNAAGEKPFYQTLIPMPVYDQTLSNTLSDLSITNAANEAIPYTFVSYETLHPNTTTREEIKPLPVYKIQTEALNAPNDLRIQLEKTTGKTSMNIISNETARLQDTVFLVDAGANHAPLRTLKVNWSGSENIFLNTEILSSDDLQNWHNVGSAVLLNTITDTNNEQLGQIADQKHAAPQSTKLLQNTISLNEDVISRYLQIRTIESAGVFKINSINAHYLLLQSIAPLALWNNPKLLGRNIDSTNGIVNIDFETNGRYPASRMRIVLPQKNMVTNVSIQNKNTINEPWHPLANASLHNDNQNEHLIATTVARYWRLQFKQSDGGIGIENPSLSLGWLPPTVIWNARGKAPYLLHVGNNPELVNTIDLSTMLPKYTNQQLSALPIATATLIADSSPKATSKKSTWAKTTDYKSWILWGVLVIGVLLLAGMAYSLLKQTNNK
jgi:Protein of unknown function (DUF3999)